MQRKRIVVVLGMHRSGTSAITRGLQVLGVDLGNRLLAAELGNNEKGFWEDVDVTAFNVDLLAHLGHDWHTLAPIQPAELKNLALESLKLRAAQLMRNKLADTDLFGLKDPRMARLMPFWLEVFEHLQLDVSYVIACRNPMNIAHSLEKRNGFALEKSYLLWYEHMLLSMKFTSSCRRIFVDYDLILSEPETQLQRIAQTLDLPFTTDSHAFVQYRNEFLESSLRHNTYAPEDLRLDTAVTADVMHLQRLLAGLAGGSSEDGMPIDEQVDALHRSMIGRYPEYHLMRSLEDQARLLGLRLVEAETIAANLAVQANEARCALAESSASVDELNRQLWQLSGESEHLSAESQRLQHTLTERAADLKQVVHALSASRTGRGALKNLAKACANRFGLARLQENRLQRRVLNSGLFDSGYYLSTYADVAEAGVNPVVHFLNQGWQEGRNPILSFSTRGYLERYPDVRVAGVNPLLHYLQHGHREGRVVPTPAGECTRLAPRYSLVYRLQRLTRLVMIEPRLVVKFLSEVRRGGLRNALARAQVKVERQWHSVDNPAREVDAKGRIYNIVPYYLNPYLHDDLQLPPLKVGVHLHLFYPDMAQACMDYLANIPLPFDLYLSVPEHEQASDWEARFRSQVALVRQFTVAQVPNRGRDLSPLIVEFGEQLASYDVVAHFHTKKSPHKTNLSGWFTALMGSLCGSRSGVSQILGLLADDANVVYPAGHQTEHWDSSGWSDNRDIAEGLLAKYSTLDIANFPQVEFPQGSMFWGKGSALRAFLTLPLAYEDFAEEPIAADATLAHALERLILVFASAHPGRNYRIESQALSDEPQQYYEEQFDFSARIVHDSIKVLAYYLPQFHPTPENDAWHGEGFTEWHKVAAANPLFQGHYQQHIPHSDIGYYHLDSPAQLSLQADMMRQACVHGLIFYHYWFSGKLILEKPAQMLLANLEINMPFSFCWANENWTRRWDGNENEILLGQVYSPEDATAFIRYLIPFFKDDRYIKVEGRPVLYVYRPSAMEHVEDYIRIWREECELNGLLAPYVVATLTRGAVEPAHYGMDAAVERVLNDWTGGAVPDIRSQLSPYGSINGSVLDYDEVADHYMHKQLGNDYTLFRSLVPTWNNTVRYGAEAILLHGFSTPKFQEWLEHLIRYSVEVLPADRRFVVINAWNEWAEGAHLEPDTRFGYGYLNCIGRALSNYPFSHTQYLESQLNTELVLRIELADCVKQQLASDDHARRKFTHCLRASTMLRTCSVYINDIELIDVLAASGIRCVDEQAQNWDFTLRFDTLYLFTASCIETLILMALRHPGFGISPSVLNDPDYLHNPHSLNFEIEYWARAGMEVTPHTSNLRGHKVACKASSFVLAAQAEIALAELDLPQISTIMRFHRQGDLDLLANAALSLVAQAGCRVRLHLAVQDLDDQDMARVEAELACVPWAAGCEPIIKRYHSSESNPDLRSLMLNETLKSVRSGFAAFLDYDDILFPHAYRSLLKRLQATGKNASFARVYSTLVDVRTGMILKRDRTYEYGFSYQEFIKLNHAPLHSFMLNLDKVDLNAVHHHDDMKYMEDYYLTLQLFSPKDTDWASLRLGEFIGDYIHRQGDDSNTLAVSDQKQRQKLLKSAHYAVCEARITELRRQLAG